MTTVQNSRFTDAELEIARSTDLPDLLTSLGYHVKQVGSYHTTAEMDSLRIRNRRSWFRYSELRGGDAISFLQRFHGMDFVEAVTYLLAWHGRARDSPSPPSTDLSSQPKKKADFSLPAPNADNRRIIAYLHKRGTALPVIRGFIDAGLLYEDKKHHNCVFVGKNRSGDAVFATKRGTFDKDGMGFKGDERGSDKTVGFRLSCAPDNVHLYVFEAPIDLMSYCTLHREVTSNAVALCGLYDGPLETYLNEHPHLRHIHLCLDADTPGRETANKLSGKYAQKGYTVSVHVPPRGKDWNEFLQYRRRNLDKER